jgi:hypothetical protein
MYGQQHMRRPRTVVGLVQYRGRRMQRWDLVSAVLWVYLVLLCYCDFLRTSMTAAFADRNEEV